MAFKTLDTLRTGVLNVELGLASDADNVWGDTTARNAFIQKAISKLWPTMGKLTRENVLTVANQQAYTLTTLYDIERAWILDPAAPTVYGDRVKSWTLEVDEAADPPTLRLLLPAGLSGGLTITLIGYAPYLVPATGATACDIPPRLEWLVGAGARVECYRAQVNKFAVFERFQNENRANALSAADVLELLRQTQREFQQGMTDNARNLTGAHRARVQVS